MDLMGVTLKSPITDRWRVTATSANMAQRSDSHPTGSTRFDTRKATAS